MLKLDSYSSEELDDSKYLAALMSMVFTADVLRNSSLSGKPPLNPNHAQRSTNKLDEDTVDFCRSKNIYNIY